MSLQKQIKRNIAKENNKLLSQYKGQLVENWSQKSEHDKDLLARMIRNGITVDDLKAERKRGRDEAFAQTAPRIMEMCYAIFSLTLADMHGFSSDECFELLTEVDKRIAVSLDHEELLKEMEDKLRIKFFAEEGIERIMQI